MTQEELDIKLKNIETKIEFLKQFPLLKLTTFIDTLFRDTMYRHPEIRGKNQTLVYLQQEISKFLTHEIEEFKDKSIKTEITPVKKKPRVDDWSDLWNDLLS
jgi:hypothetical protein